jgi:hypothetical protein
VSGAQWSAERLRELAQKVEMLAISDAPSDFPWKAADALRAFARVVSVLDGSRHVKLTKVPSDTGWLAEYPTSEHPFIAVKKADTPLAAILSLADALDAGRDDA